MPKGTTSDLTDKQLLRAVGRQRGGRSTSEVAERAGCSVAVVRRRLKRLRDSGLVEANLERANRQGGAAWRSVV